MILVNPMYYSRNKDTIRAGYHICVWLLAICSCIPALAANMIGASLHVGMHGLDMMGGRVECPWHVLV